MDIAHQLAEEVRNALGETPRVIVGIAGEPGAGKSTLAGQTQLILEQAGIKTAVVPMDGYHLANEVLESLARRDRKGAIDTFDASGYLSMLRRLRSDASDTVYAPLYDRDAGHGVAGAIPVAPDCRVVLTEGNYLLDGDATWNEAAGLLDAIWFVQIDPLVRRERLIARHIASGKDPDFAEYWVDNVDEANARRIRACAAKADRIVDPG